MGVDWFPEHQTWPFLSKMDHNSHDYLSHETNSPINAGCGCPLLRLATQKQQCIFLTSLSSKIWFIEQMKYIEQHGPSHNCYCKVPSLCTFIVGTSVTEYFLFHHLTGCRVTHTHIESNNSYAPYYSQQPYKPVFPIEMHYTAH